MKAIRAMLVCEDQSLLSSLEEALSEAGFSLCSTAMDMEELPGRAESPVIDLAVLLLREQHNNPESLKDIHNILSVPLIALIPQQRESPHFPAPYVTIIRYESQRELISALRIIARRQQMTDELQQQESQVKHFIEEVRIGRDFALPELARYRIAQEVLEKGAWLNHLSLETLPLPLMVIRSGSREILYSNHAARKLGALEGRSCYETWWHRNCPCSFCLAPDLWTTQEPQFAEAEGLGRIWGCYWEPMEQDIYLHYIMDVSERKKAEDQIKESLREKETLLRELHHRVKNNLQSISSLLNLQSRYLNDSKVAQVLRESQNRIRSIALIHDRLYQSEQLNLIDLKKYLETIVNHLLRSYESSSVDFKIDGEASAGIDLETAVPLGLIINEIISNSLKHAFPEGRKGTVSCTIAGRENQTELTIRDDGTGIPPCVAIENPSSLGLQLIHDLMGQLEGTMTLDRSRGTSYTLSFKSLSSVTE